MPRQNPPKFGNVHNSIDTVFMPVIEQHMRILELAASRGWGLGSLRLTRFEGSMRTLAMA